MQILSKKNWRKARVIRKLWDNNSTAVTKKETVMDGIAVGFTNSGAYVFNPKEQEREDPIFAEWFSYNSKEIETIVYA